MANPFEQALIHYKPDPITGEDKRPFPLASWSLHSIWQIVRTITIQAIRMYYSFASVSCCLHSTFPLSPHD